MSCILTKLSAVRKTRLLSNSLINRKYFVCPSTNLNRKLRKADVNPALLTIQPEFKCLKQFDGYSVVNKPGPTPNIDPIVKTLSKLTAGTVSLPFHQKFDHIRPSLLKNYDINVIEGFDILKSCSRLVDRTSENRVQMVDEVWQQLLPMMETPNKNNLILLIEAYRRAGRKSLEDYHSFFEQYKCPLDVHIYEELMYLACQNDDSMTNALKIFEDFKSQGLKPTERMYAALIMGYAKEGIPAFENILEDLKKNNITPSAVTSMEMIKAYLQNGNKDKALEWLERGDEFNSDQLYEIIRTSIQKRQEEVIIRVLDFLPESIRFAKLIAPELQNICIEALYLNDNRSPDDQIDLYQLIIRHLPAPEFVNENTGDYGKFLLKEMIAKNENLSKILEYCEILIESKRNLRSIHYCCLVAMLHKHPLAGDLLKTLAEREPLRPHYFWPLFAQAKSDEEVFKTLRLAKELKTTLDVDTYLYYILPRLPCLLDPQQTLRSLMDGGGRMNVLKTTFVAFLVQNNRIEDALEIATRSQADVDPYILLPAFVKFICSKNFNAKQAFNTATLLKKLQMKSSEENYDLAGEIARAISRWDGRRDFDTIKKLIKAYSSVGVLISRNAAELIIYSMEKNRYVHDHFKPIIIKLISDELFPVVHEKQKHHTLGNQVEVLERQYSEFKASGFPVHGILYKLFAKYVQLKQYDEAMKVRKKCEEEGVIETPVYLAQTIQLWVAAKQSALALETFKLLSEKHPKFKLDEFKVVDLASGLIIDDRFDDAINVLKTVQCAKDFNTDFLKSNVYKLLNAAREYGVRHQKKANVANELLNLLLAKKLTKATNLNLGPVIKEYFDKKDLSGAVTAFKEFAKQFNETPHIITLGTELLKIINSVSDDEANVYNLTKSQALEYFQQIIECSSAVHGPERANVHVILSFASCGNETQLRKIMMDPKIKFDAKQLLDSLQFFKNNKIIDVVIAIARSARGLSYVELSEENMYGILLSHFIRENDHQSAIQFYDELLKNAEGEIPTSIGKTLAGFLERNQQELPEQLKGFAGR